MPTIDIHTHFFPQQWPDFTEQFGTPDWPSIRHTEPGKAVIMLGNREFRRIYSACWDPQLRLEEMDRDGVDVQLMCATPVLFSYQRPAEHALEVAKFFNDAALELCSSNPSRLKALCQVPLQDIDAACKELSRCMKAGHLGVQIGNHVGEKNLDDPGVLTFLQHCANEGAAVLVHPWDMMGRDRMTNYMLPWTVAMPAETHLGIVSLIVSGAFDRLPKSLRLCFAHGGGSFAFLLGRLQNAWEHHPIARGCCERSPKEYVDRFYVDSAVFDERALKFLIETMSEDRVVLGSDYPFPLGEEHVGRLVRESHLPVAVKTKILGDNAAQWLNLPVTQKKTDTAPLPAEIGCPFKGEGSKASFTDIDQTSVEKLLTYGSYLKISDLLALQELKSSPPKHDELLFIIIHQTYELWFKELLHDLDAIVASMKAVAVNSASRDEVYEAARLLRRCTEIMRVLVSQFTILETMLPTHFLAFRGKLEPASGFQSEQFREIEFVCGMKDAKLLHHHEHAPQAHARLRRRMEEPSLHDVFFDALHSIGKLKTPRPESNFDERAEAIRDLYEDERNYRDWLDVCERLTEFDELVVGWRLRHIQMVERTIGLRMGTGGSEGSSYLRTTLDKRFFPELWQARTMLRQPEGE
ncbi:MAG TPA: tryptophan 2,3-dioxygenase family protein [Terriglobales bacterium]|nr:tryptophan 2,3-dioxygenase family protein [Terriglobales bacterium]